MVSGAVSRTGRMAQAVASMPWSTIGLRGMPATVEGLVGMLLG